MTSILVLVIIALAAVVALVLIRSQLSNVTKDIETLRSGIQALNVGEKIESLKTELEKSGSAVAKSVSDNLGTLKSDLVDRVTQLNKDVTKSGTDVTKEVMTQVSESTLKINKIAADLSQKIQSMEVIGSDVKDLQKTLSNAKLRGNFGEGSLEDLIKDKIPSEYYELQHKFKDGQTVDAIIKTANGIIPIDSKFPADNYLQMVKDGATEDEKKTAQKEFVKMVKKHIEDIAKKYILPGEGTLNMAIMFVPSEAIFYEIISGDELPALANERKVLMTSPNTMYYMLHILKQSYDQISIEANAKEILKMLDSFQQETAKFGETLGVVAKHVTDAKNRMDGAVSDYGRLSTSIDQIRQLK
jgi:DNA recombination protein RmuC